MSAPDPPKSDDAPILPRIAAGDSAAVQEALDRFGGLVWSLARRFTRSAADAEDAVQEVFIAVWSNAGRYDASIASETTFVSMLARRRLIDRLRKKGREPVSESIGYVAEMPAEEGKTPQQQLEIDEASAQAEAVLEELRPEQRDVLRLSIYGGWSHQKISEQLSLPLGTVKTHARRGLIRIREQLGVAADEKPATDNRGDSK
ncbi:MAG: sigma-70 family RNA polymerase sigma factor [Planctomycetota bacterium]